MNYFQQIFCEWRSHEGEKKWNANEIAWSKSSNKKVMRRKKSSQLKCKEKLRKFPFGLELRFSCFLFSFFIWNSVCVIASMCKTAGSKGTGTRNAKLLFLFVFRCHWNEFNLFRSTWIPTLTYFCWINLTSDSQCYSNTQCAVNEVVQRMFNASRRRTTHAFLIRAMFKSKFELKKCVHNLRYFVNI